MSLHVQDADVSKIIDLMLTVLVLCNDASALTIQTEDVIVISQEHNRIMLNCTFHYDSNEQISNSDIRWQKQIGDVFETIAAFSPPDGLKPFVVEGMSPFYKNRTELIAPSQSSLAAVLIIKEPVCSDEGIYRCWIEYIFPGSLGETETSLSTVSFNAKAREPGKFVVLPDRLEENQSISLICSADVGSPRGNITIWKISDNSDTPEFIYVSNYTNNKTDSCTEIINFTFSVSREDNDASFRCSSQNNMTKGPGPSKDSQKISVLYGPDETAIMLVPSKSMYTVGESLTVQCTTKSNPPPAYRWYFQSNTTSKETLIELTDDKLVFNSLQIENSGTYVCTVVNGARLNSPNASSHVSVFVEKYHGCSQCRYIEICRRVDDEIMCIYNKWIHIAVVFMILSVTLGVTTIVLFIHRKRSQETKASNKIHNTRYHPYNTTEDNGGEYSSPSDLNRMQGAGSPTPEDILSEPYSQPRDLIKIQEQCSLLTHNHQPDEYTTTGDVVEYAAVQKQSTKDSQESSDNLYDSAWNSEQRPYSKQEAN